MTTTPDDLLITGTGVVSPIGIGHEPFWNGLMRGEGGMRFTEPLGGVAGRQWMAGLLEGFDPKQYVQPRKSLKIMAIETQMAFAAAVLACRESGIETGRLNPDRLGTVFGSEILFSENEDIRQIVSLCQDGQEMQHSQWGAKAMSNMYPLWMLKSLPNMPACHIGIWLDARGPNNTITTEETSGLNAIIEAAHVIRRGQADCMLVGASGNRTSLTRMLQRHEANISKAYADPRKACKPFDKNRDGTVPALGAAVIVLERRSHAEVRGAKPIARLMGWSSTFGKPAKDLAGSSDAVARAIRQAMHRASVAPEDIDHVNANANGAIALDASEARGIRDTLGETPVTSIKGYIGDSGCSSGLIELCGSLMGVASKCVPRTLNHEVTGMDCPVKVIYGSEKTWTKPCFVKTSLTPYGQAAALLFRSE